MRRDVLQQFGLTPMEVEMYETLLPMGDVPMAEVIRAVGRHPQVVYRLVDQLLSKGLAIIQTRRHRRYVCAQDPERVVEAEVHKLEELRAVLPELKALQHAPRQATIQVQRGPEAIQGLRARAFEELPSGDTYYILGASGDRFYEIMGEHFERTERRRIERKVKKKMLAYETQRTLLMKNECFMTGVELRYLQERFKVPSSTNIFGTTTAILIWPQDPIVVLIESKEVAQSYKDYFHTLWRMARP